jgi:acyl carrier protein
MTRDAVRTALLKVFAECFEIKDPGEGESLREVYEFDSIDAVELLREIELLLGSPLTYEEKKGAMEIRTFGQIVDYVLALAATRPAR